MSYFTVSSDLFALRTFELSRLVCESRLCKTLLLNGAQHCLAPYVALASKLVEFS